MITADAFFLPVNVNDECGCIRIRVHEHEGSNGLALQLVLPTVVGRVDVVADLDVRFASCYQGLSEHVFLATYGREYGCEVVPHKT